MCFMNFYLRKSKFFIPKYPIRDFLVKEANGGGLTRHFWINKTYNILHEHFFWLEMKNNVHKFCSQCFKCKESKSKLQSNELFTPLHVPNEP